MAGWEARRRTGDNSALVALNFSATPTTDNSALVALNFSATPTTISVAAEKYGLKDVQATTLISNTSPAGTHVLIDKLTLSPFGAFIGAVSLSR